VRAFRDLLGHTGILTLAFTVRGSLPPAAAESHTHLAHAIVRFMGLAGPQDLVQFGINSAGELVDMISQVHKAQRIE